MRAQYRPVCGGWILIRSRALPLSGVMCAWHGRSRLNEVVGHDVEQVGVLAVNNGDFHHHIWCDAVDKVR